MEITLPAIPAGVITLLGLLAPYAIALINHPAWPAGSKRIVSIAVSLALTVLALVMYFVITGDAVPGWPLLLILGLIVSQAAYALLSKGSATRIEGRYGVR